MCKHQTLQARGTSGRSGSRRWHASAAALITAGSLTAACGAGPELAATGSFSGQVVVSGPLRSAKVTIDQIDASDPALGSLFHVADTTTDDEGRFSVDAGIRNGVLLITATGGSFVDAATGTTIQLDANDGLSSFVLLDLLDTRDDALVSPIGHLIVARTRYKAAGELHDARRPLDLAEPDAARRLGRHFGNVDWTRQKLASLQTVAISPTEPVRAALVQAALSELAHDIAVASGASPQEVNVLTLTQQLAADVSEETFDGNDHNSTDFTQGLQLGVCAPAAPCTVPPGSCAVGACRPLCDLYAGTPRALLAGELIKVIGSAQNQTRLEAADVLAIARAMAEDADPDLFDDPCLEDLDRIPPRLEWVAPTPGAMAYVRGVVPVKVRAIDDTDPMPQVWIDDRAPTGSIAEAAIDTMAINGPLVVTATAKDMAGNLARLALPPVIADNLAPTLTLDRGGFFADGNTWWTTVSTPTLAGTVADASPLTVTTTTQAGVVTAAVTGGSWTGGVAGNVDQGVDVTVTATDAAGNHAQVTQRIHADVTPPRLAVQSSLVHDEALEVPAFDASEAPVHTHTGAPVDLAVENGCPAVTKFSHLLGASLPPYGHEVDDHGTPRRNPLHYVLVASDDGVGIVAGSMRYHVGYGTTTGTTWIHDWTSAGPPTPSDVGGDQYDIGIFDDAVPQLATTEGIYVVEFQATDRLGRTTTVHRCFDLHLRAPPLHFQVPGAPPGTDPDPIPVDHAYRLLSLHLGVPPPFSAIADRLLNDNATGASLLDEDVTNGTASTVYLEVNVTKPTKVFAGQSFKLENLITTQAVNIECTDFGDGAPPPALCTGATSGPTYASAAPRTDQEISGLSFPVRVFELDGSLHPATEVPCVAGGGDRWKFAIPPRPVDASGPLPPRRFKVMTMISQVSLLWPSDSNFPATAPFVDTTLNGRPFTGRISPTSTGCTSHNVHTLPDGTRLDTCTRVSHITPYRVLTSVHLQTGSQLRSTYATAPTPTSTPAIATITGVVDPFPWNIFQGALPSDPP